MSAGTVRVGKLRRDRGISVARPTALGNPFVVGVHGTQEACVAQYRAWLPTALPRRPMALEQFERIVEQARQGDVTLLCWCRSVDETQPACHADVVADLVREHLSRSDIR